MSKDSARRFKEQDRAWWQWSRGRLAREVVVRTLGWRTDVQVRGVGRALSAKQTHLGARMFWQVLRERCDSISPVFQRLIWTPG